MTSDIPQHTFTVNKHILSCREEVFNDSPREKLLEFMSHDLAFTCQIFLIDRLDINNIDISDTDL